MKNIGEGLKELPKNLIKLELILMDNCLAENNFKYLSEGLKNLP